MKDWIDRYPGLLMWLVLALGMNGILIYEARDVGLNGSQWFWLIVLTTLVAGACVWIINWGDDESEMVNEE